MKRALILMIAAALLLVAADAADESAFAASIIANPWTGNAPLNVQFSVNSTAQIASYSWDFNNDGAVDSTQPSPSFTYSTAGNYVIKLDVTDANGTVAVDTKTVAVKTLISISLSANPASGNVPLNIQFNAIATGQEPLQYNWDFNSDNVIDDFTQNPKLTLNSAGTIVAKLTVIDATGNSATKNVTVTARLLQTSVELVSFFPATMESGEQTVTFIIKNSGKDVLTNLEGKLIGNGIQHISSTKIPALNPGDQDSFSVTAKFLQSGNLSATMKIAEKSIPVRLAVGSGLSAKQLQDDIDVLRDQAQGYENQYTQKKADGYFVDTAIDSIKTARGYITSAQEALLQGKLSSANLNINLASERLKDANDVLQNAARQKTSATAWLKENALAITATIAALGALGTIFSKIFGHAKRFHESIKTTLTEKRHRGKKRKRTKKKHESESRTELQTK